MCVCVFTFAVLLVLFFLNTKLNTFFLSNKYDVVKKNNLFDYGLFHSITHI